MPSAGSLLGTSKTQDLVLLGVLVLGGYVLYKVFGAVSATVGAVGSGAKAVAGAVAGGYTATVDALGSGLYSLFGPDDAKALGSMTYFTVTFPDGTRHAVPANTVNSNGMFIWTGYPPNSADPVTLTLVKDNTGAWFATSDTPTALAPSQLQPVTLDLSTTDPSNVVFGQFGNRER